MKNNKIMFMSVGILGFLGLGPRNLALENAGGLSKMMETNISFILECYPEYLQVRDEGRYGEKEIKEWGWEEKIGRKWWPKNNPNGLYVTEFFNKRGYNIVSSLPFERKGNSPFDVAPMGENFDARVMLVEEDWASGSTHYEYWFVFIASAFEKRAGVVFLLTEYESKYDRRKVVWCGTNYRNSFVLNGETFSIDESNLEKFKSMNIYNYSRSFEGSIWEKQMVVFNPTSYFPESGNMKDLKDMIDRGEIEWPQKGYYTLEKIPWSAKRYKDLFDTPELAEVLQGVLEKHEAQADD